LPEKTVAAEGRIVYRERSLELNGKELVIADDIGPMALAGLKGGMRAVVTENTKNLIIESANFDPVSVRRTSTVHNVRNDSSKRFET
jgi:phenylalanyl-tRNA synthetase beta chain